MPKIFVLDTSVVLHDPVALAQFGEHDLVVPLAVLSEVDLFKNGEDQKAFHAREFSRKLDALKELHATLLEFVPLPEPSTGRIRLAGAGEWLAKVPREFDQMRKDREIIATALRIHETQPEHEVVLVSKDTNVRLMGHACGLQTEDYKRGQIRDVDSLRQGPVVLEVGEEIVDRLQKEGTFPLHELEGSEGLKRNQCLTLISHGTNKSALAVVNGTSDGPVLKRLQRDEARLWNLTPRNREQIFASALLRDPEIRLLSLVGKAGTGKTLLALAAALEQVADPKRRLYRKIVVVRPFIAVGKELGWLPGDVGEKMQPWMKPVFDNIALLLGDEKEARKEGREFVRAQQLIDQGLLELEPLTFVRGRSINDAFLIIDEAQNLTPHEIKTLLTRAAGRSKVILTGDPGQIDTPYLDSHSSGLTHVVKKFAGKPIAAHVTLTKGERSELAELAADLL